MHLFQSSHSYMKGSCKLTSCGTYIFNTYLLYLFLDQSTVARHSDSDTNQGVTGGADAVSGVR